VEKNRATTLGLSARKDGDADAALKGAAKTLEAAYEFPYLAHASMEPMNCVVKLDGGGCEIWNGEQFQTADQAAVVKLLGLEAGQVPQVRLRARGRRDRQGD
jgi:isoquinoline 1-oxidoreductase subunit beta